MLGFHAAFRSFSGGNIFRSLLALLCQWGLSFSFFGSLKIFQGRLALRENTNVK